MVFPRIVRIAQVNISDVMLLNQSSANCCSSARVRAPAPMTWMSLIQVKAGRFVPAPGIGRAVAVSPGKVRSKTGTLTKINHPSTAGEI
jgi:hypothetical protein